MKKLLIVTAISEGGAGLAMLVLPSLLSMLLLGISLTTPVELVLARTAGVALLTLGAACWLARDDVQSKAALGVISAMLIYNVGVAILLVYAALGLGLSGILLWPFVLVHAAMGVWCVRCLLSKPAHTAIAVLLMAALVALGACTSATPAPATQSAAGAAQPGPDPLPSWNEGPVKQAILKFVKDVTDPTGASYVPPEERIAVTDNDGTLWTEKAIPAQAAFVFARIAQMAPDHPEWKTTQPFQAVLEQDTEAIASLSEGEVAKLIAVTHTGMSADEFLKLAQGFLSTAKHPRFNLLYTQTVYQPMLELLALLHANGFKTFIVSGGGTEFMRAYAEPVYGIPPENVIGSSLKYEFKLTEAGPVIMRLPEIVSFDNEGEKPVNIQRVIGRRPILAAGNSDGDLQMFQYTGASKGPFLVLLLVHDDAEREYEYLEGAEAVTAAAAQNHWTSVSMKGDFARMFPSVSGE